MPQRHFVTRHPGAITWAVRHGLRARKVAMENFDPAVVRPGDVVIGTLPIHLVAVVNQRGGHYWHLTMEVPPAWRGRELSADDMDACGARLHEFRVLSLGSRSENMGGPEVWDEHPEASARPVLHLCIATGQQLPNAVPIKLRRWDRVVIFASLRMKASAEKLTAFVADTAASLGLPPESAEALLMRLPQESNAAEVRAAVQAAVLKLRRQFPLHQLELNITGGMKLMTLGFADALRGQARILYCDAERGALETVEPEGEPAVPLGPELDLATYLRVQGWHIVGGGVPTAEEQRRIGARSRLTATLALQLPVLSPELTAFVDGFKSPCKGLMALLHALAAEALDSARRGPFQPLQQARRQGDAGISPEGMALLRHLRHAGLLVKGTEVQAKAHSLRVSFADEAAARYVAGGYLEEFAWLSARAAGLPEAHVGMNTSVDRIERRAGRRQNELNEIDVGVAWNARLLVIECKAGRQLSHGEKVQSILHKAASIRSAVGGALARGWIIGNTPLPSASEADIRERAKLNQLEVRLGAGELASLPATIAQWAGLAQDAAGFDWRAEVLPLADTRPAAASPGRKR